MKRLAAEKLLEANMASEERVENKRFLGRLQLEAREREIEQALFQVNNIIFYLALVLPQCDLKFLINYKIICLYRKMKLGY
jgi:hypothetical protein